MTDRPDYVGEYLAIALGGGVIPDDPRLWRLLGQMTPGEIEAVKQRLIGEYIAELPPGPPGSDAPVLDFGGLYLELVRRGARPDAPRLAVLGALMTGEERARAKAGIGELWLQAEPRPARVN